MLPLSRGMPEKQYDLNQNRMPDSLSLLRMLSGCVDRANAAFHTPGHKGHPSSIELQNLLGTAVFRADLPELPELDNLFAPQGVIAEAQNFAAKTFGADQTYFLVNGSSCGIIAAILATCAPGDKILLPRNVHRSIISGLILSGAMPIFLQPESDRSSDIAHSITPETVAIALKQHPDAKAVLMVYPTYYGVCGNIAAIATIAHAANIPLLVDEAHGAHFAFHPAFPISALNAGADLTVQSTHKTLSAFTQASMLHTKGDRIDSDRLIQALQLVQSTSPNYILLASLDSACAQLAQNGKALMTRSIDLANQARSRLAIQGLSILQPQQTPGFFAIDSTRLTVRVSGLGIDGFVADEILHSLGVTAELPSMQHLTFIISWGNTEEDIDRLIHAFETLAANYRSDQTFQSVPVFELAEATMTPREAFFARSEVIEIENAIDRTSSETVCPYPPGIPVLLPGERITKGAIKQLQAVLQAGGSISGCADPSLSTLKVVKLNS